MLEQKDIRVLRNLIAEIVDERMNKTEEWLEHKIETRATETERQLERKIETRAIETDKLFMEEIGFVQIHANKRFDRMQKDLDEMKSYYRTRRLDDTATICIKTIPDLQRRVYRLEQMMMCSA